jgi:hypothetical protein
MCLQDEIHRTHRIHEIRTLHGAHGIHGVQKHRIKHHRTKHHRTPQSLSKADHHDARVCAGRDRMLPPTATTKAKWKWGAPRENARPGSRTRRQKNPDRPLFRRRALLHHELRRPFHFARRMRRSRRRRRDRTNRPGRRHPCRVGRAPETRGTNRQSAIRFLHGSVLYVQIIFSSGPRCSRLAPRKRLRFEDRRTRYTHPRTQGWVAIGSRCPRRLVDR